ncbi:radical SAM protein [Caldichromatium japonicum]|uniref:Radical SAM protein n=1 Tax=Caldichromatium japonicum TaxID=2699430 RepID=A0A6G7VGD8_9GAMM|nr:Stf0 family sulfotransferase [Caldichromatium japonicum]QIK38857.1 radical SAM protein [Caldichromatium japonicum]
MTAEPPTPFKEAPSLTDTNGSPAAHPTNGDLPAGLDWWPQRLEAIARLSAWSQGGPPPEAPAELFLEVSNVCDLKCAMCPTFSGLSPSRLFSIKEQERGFIDLERLWPSLEPILPQVISVHCFGYGEPTLHPDFIGLIKQLSTYRVLIDFFTNGMHLDEQFCELLVENWVFSVTLSISGVSAEAYESVYLGGRFDRVLAGIRRLTEYKRAFNRRYPRIEVNSIAFEHQVRDLPRFVDLMADCGVEIIHLKALQTFETTKELAGHRAIFRPWIDAPILEEAERRAQAHGLILSTDQYRQTAVADESSWRAARGDVSATLPLAELPSAARRLQPHRPPPGHATETRLDTGRLAPEALETVLAFAPYPGPEPFYCLEPFKTLYVRRSGHTKPCCFAHDAGPSVGQLGEIDAKQLWQGQPFQSIRTGILDQRYPQALCAYCLREGYGPRQQNLPDQLAQYRDWLAASQGLQLSVSLPTERLTNRQIVERWRANAPEAYRALLAEIRQLHTEPPSDLIEGHLDGIIDGTLHGWIWSPRAPDLHLWVEVRVDGQPWRRLRADAFRADLVQAGKGDGYHAFQFASRELPTSRSIAVYLADTDWLLGRLPLQGACAQPLPGQVQGLRDAAQQDLGGAGQAPLPLKPLPFLLDYEPGIHERLILRHFARPLGDRPGPRPPALEEPPELVVVIAFTNRSGSNLLAKSLAASGLINRAEEAFTGEHLIKTCERLGLQDLSDYLLHLKTELGPRFAVKLSWDQLFFLWRIGVIPHHWPRVRFIWIERQDLLAQAMSYLVAERTGCWSGAYPPDLLERVLAELTPVDLIRRLELLTFAQRQLHSLFALYGIRPSRVIYERLAADPESEARRVLGEIGLLPADSSWSWDPTAIQSRRQRTPKIMARLQGLIAAIRGMD